jgi:peptidoglycan-N-acetylglucosamine deacetylase
MLNALSIDVEAWHHAELVRPHAEAGDADRVAEATLPILDLLDRYGTKATFFIVGKVAHEAPHLVREIARRGHEIGCHGMSHLMLHNLDAERFGEELDGFARIMELLGVGPIAGYRAPTFSLDQRTSWAIPALVQRDYTYDSSIFPMRSGLYGVAGAPLAPYRIGSANVARPDPRGKLWEVPMSVWQAGPLRVPVSGGFYLRAIPFPLLAALLGRINAAKRPIVLYLHPWETHAGTPHVEAIPALARWATYLNLDKTMSKLERLLQRFSFAPVAEVLARWTADAPSPSAA